MKKYIDYIKVRCKYEKHFDGYKCMDKFDCRGISNNTDCKPFNISWTKYLIHKQHLIKIK